MTTNSADANPTPKPVIFLAFANDRDDRARYLRNLPEEARRVRTALRDLERRDHCEVVERTNATIADLLDTFQDGAYRQRIAIFHYGGHADGYHLLLENSAGQPTLTRADHLAAFLGEQRSLRLVFLNGCATQQQVQGLLAANVDVVIATDQDIVDDVAMHFAERFYRGLASGATLQIAYREAEAAARLIAGDNHGRHLRPAPASGQPQPPATWPWSLHHRPGDEAKLQWRLATPQSPVSGLQSLPPNPYRGLEPFEAEHAANYFGREAMVAKLLEKLKVENFVAVVGPSGSGKSSLVRAGLVTALRAGKLPGSRDWQIEILRPGEDPLRALATPLVARIGANLKPVERLKQVREMALSLQDGTLPMGDVLAEVRSLHPGLPRLFLVFDQFEETFTLCSDEPVRRTFLQRLLAAANTPWLTVLFTLRADFYGRVLEDEPFGRRVDAGLVNVLPMTAAERRTAIEQPALNAGRHFEERLVQRILDEIEAEPGELPLLQFALTELWERQTPAGLLTHAAYDEIGGVTGAIARRADQTLQGLPAVEQAAARRVFTRLVRVAQPDEGAEDTKRRIPLDELEPAMQSLVRKLADVRLLVTDRDAATGVETVEVAHEALIRGWDELKGWLNSDREFLLWRQRLRALVANWFTSKQDEGALLRGALLSEAETQVASHGADLNDLERAFVLTSRSVVDREAQEREAARRRELEQAQQLAAETEARRQAEQERAEQANRDAALLRRRARYLIAAVVLALGLAGVTLYLLGLARAELTRQSGTKLLQTVIELAAAGNFTEAIATYKQAIAADPTLPVDAETAITGTIRNTATRLVQEGEELLGKARRGGATNLQMPTDLASTSQPQSPLATPQTSQPGYTMALQPHYLAWAESVISQTSGWTSDIPALQQQAIISASALFSQAQALNPPADTPIYVWIEPGQFVMGSTDKQCKAAGLDNCPSDEEPTPVKLAGYWILRTEVTNEQYKRCTDAGACEALQNPGWDKPQNAKKPVVYVDWNQARIYAEWVGGRLPTEAEWEHACRGADGRIYPWGNQELSPERLNYYGSNINTAIDVGSYPPGANGLYDMAGNVWEWTSSQYQAYPYEPDDGREVQTGDADRTLRGGAFFNIEDLIRCASRFTYTPTYWFNLLGFRVVSPGF